MAAPTAGNERCFRCTTAGTSGTAEATWTLTYASTTTQGTAIFTEITGQEAYQAAGAWAAPHARVGNAFASGWMVAGDTAYVAANHAESTAGMNFNTSSLSTVTRIICVDNSGTGHVPPGSTDLRATAQVTVNGGYNSLVVGMSSGYVYGIIFISNGSSCAINLGVASGFVRFDSCGFQFLAAASLSLVANSCIDWNSCEFTPNGHGSISVNSVIFRWRNSAPAVGSVISSVFNDSGGMVLLDGLDFSGYAHTQIFSGTAAKTVQQMVNCKLNVATLVNGSASNMIIGSTSDAIGTDSGSATTRSERYQWTGTLLTSTAIIHTAGASDGTTGFAWSVVTTANPKWSAPFECFSIMQWNALIGSAHTVSFEAVANAATVLNNDQLWMDVEFLGTASGTLASLATTTKATPLTTATALTASTQAWDSKATAHAISAAYVVGNVIAVSSNTGRIFFCITAGTSASSLPAGYASAVDGGSVTDGTAVFRAGVRMTVSLSLTPQVAGLIRATPKIGVASTTCYIDPLLSVV